MAAVKLRFKGLPVSGLLLSIFAGGCCLTLGDTSPSTRRPGSFEFKRDSAEKTRFALVFSIMQARDFGRVSLANSSSSGQLMAIAETETDLKKRVCISSALSRMVL